MFAIHFFHSLPVVIFPSSGRSDSNLCMLRLIIDRMPTFIFFIVGINYNVKVFVCHFKNKFVSYLLLTRYFHSLPICPHFKRLCLYRMYGSYCPCVTSVLIIIQHLFIRHISSHCGHSKAHYKHLHIINNIMIKMSTVKLQDKI